MAKNLTYLPFALIGISLIIALGKWYSGDDSDSNLEVITGQLRGEFDKSDTLSPLANSTRSQFHLTKGPSSNAVPNGVTTQKGLNDLSDLLDQIASSSEDQTVRAAIDSRYQADLDSLASLNISNRSVKIRKDAMGNILSVSGVFQLAVKDFSESAIGQGVIDLIDSHKSIFGVGLDESLVINRAFEKNPSNDMMVRLDREYKGLPIWGREIVVNAKDGKVLLIAGKLNPILEEIDLKPKLSDADLTKSARESIIGTSDSEFGVKDIDRGILIYSKIPILAYRVVAAESEFKEWELYFAANTGLLIQKIPLFFDVATASSGTDLKNNVQTFISDYSGGKYYMVDNSFPAASNTKIGDWGEDGGTLPIITSLTPEAGWDPAAVSAVNNSKQAYNYFFNTHSRDSYDGKGSELVSIVNYLKDGNPIVQAFWSNGAMVYGTGAGAYKNMAIALDVAAHEFSHGVIQHSSNLKYQNQSGALNESFADFFGAMVDRNDWTIGEDLREGLYDRNMKNPSEKGQPSHMSDYRKLSLEEDAGGVHTNSGIPNRVLYLIAEGLSNEHLGFSIGKEKTEKLVYETLLNLTSDSEFIDAANMMMIKAENSYGEGSRELQAVEDAWNIVGVTSSVVELEGGTGITSLNPGDDVLVHLYPKDGSMDNLWSEEYDVYVQTVNQPFSGHISSLQYGPLNDVPAKGTKPTLYTTSSGTLYVIYVGNDDKARWTSLAPGGEDWIWDFEDVSTIATSPDNDVFAVVVNNSNTIFIYDYLNEEWDSVIVYGPGYSVGGTGTKVDLVDTINFDTTGQKIIFDYKVCKAALDGSDCQDIWSIGIYDVGTKSFEYPFSEVSPKIDLGFPQFANQRDDVITFDYVDWRDFDTDGQSVSRSLIYSLASRTTLAAIATIRPDSEKESAWGIPSFVGEDKALALQSQSESSTVMWQVSLGADYKVDSTPPKWLTPFESGFGQAHRNAFKDISASLVAEKASIDAGRVLMGSPLTGKFRITNNGNREIAITSFGSLGSLNISLTNRTILAGESVSFSASIPTSSGIFSKGPIGNSFSINHTGDNGSLLLGLSGYVDIDTDADGVGNDMDLDDDGDGLTDTQEATYGTNPLLKDSDSDGYSDKDEIDMGTDPLDANSVPSSGLSMILIKAFLDKQKAASQVSAEQ